MNPPGTLVVRRVIRASREDIFDMWTRADSLRRWMRPPRALGATAESDPRVGGRYCIVMHGERDYDHHGEYLVVDRPSKLSFTWISEGSDYQTSVVTVELFDRARVKPSSSSPTSSCRRPRSNSTRKAGRIFSGSWRRSGPVTLQIADCRFNHHKSEI